MPANKNDPQLAYSMKAHNGRFEVNAASGRIVMVCADENSAIHYASLLNEAHQAGYKVGYRAGRKHP